jgi:hypothetical protein
VLVGDEVQTLSGPDGSVLSRLPVPAEGTDVDQTTVDAVSLIRVGGTVTALDASTGAALWEAPASGLPAPAGAVTEDDEPAALVLPDERGFATRDPASGAELDRFAVSGLPGGGAVAGVGPVVVVRLDDRVLGYR